MPTTLKLKLRERADSVRVPVQLILAWMELDEETAKDRMFTFFSPFDEADAKIHDKDFLESTINWTPVQMTERGPVSKGLPLTEQVRWIRLAQKLNEVPDDKEGEIILANKDIDLIIERWKDKEFKISAMQPWTIEFLMDFQEATNRWFPELEPEPEIEDAESPESSDDGRREPTIQEA